MVFNPIDMLDNRRCTEFRRGCSEGGWAGWPTHCPSPFHSTHHPKSGCPTHRALCDVWVLSPPPCKPITSKLDQQPILFLRDQGTHPLLRHSAPAFHHL